MKVFIILCFLVITFKMQILAKDNNYFIYKDEITNALNKTESNSGIGQGKKREILQIHQNSLSLLEEYRGNLEKIQKIEREFKELTNVEALRNAVNRFSASDNSSLITNLSLQEMELKLKELQDSSEPLKEEYEAILEMRKDKETALFEIPIKVADLKKSSKESEAQFEELSKKSEQNDFTVAMLKNLEVKKLEAETEIKALGKELYLYSENSEYLELKATLLEKKLNNLKKIIDLYSEKINQKKNIEANNEVEQAKKLLNEVARLDPIIKNLADYNTYLAEMRTGPEGLTLKIQAESIYKENIISLSEKISSEFKSLKNKIEITGITSILGLYLRKYLNDLPEIRQHYKKIEERKKEILDIQKKIMILDHDRSQEDHLNEQTAAVLEKINKESQLQVKKLVKNILETRREYLNNILSDFNKYLILLFDSESSELQLIREIKKYKTYLYENIFWVRSSNPVSVETFVQALQGIDWFIAYPKWFHELKTIHSDYQEIPFVYLLFFLVIVSSMFIRKKLLTNIRSTGQPSGSGFLKNSSSTIEEKLLSIINSLFFPFLMYFVGWRLSSSPVSNDFSRALSQGIIATSFILFPVLFILQVLKKDGLALLHFGWSSSTVEMLRKSIKKFIFLIIPVLLIISFFEYSKEDVYRESLARILFIGTLTILLIFFNQFFSSLSVKALFENQIYQKIFPKKRYFSLLLTRGIPLILLVMAVLGFYFSAIQLSVRIHFSICTIFLVIIFRAFFVRLLLHLPIKKFMLVEDSFLPENPELKKENQVLTIQRTGEAENFNPFKNLNKNTRRISTFLTLFFISFGFYYIWRDMLPAFNPLKNITLWEVIQHEERAVVDAGGSSITETTSRLVHITLGDCLTATLIFLSLFFFRKHICKLLDHLFLKRLKINDGEKKSILNLTGYVIMLLGIIIPSAYLGISWAKIQWLVAAFGVGLGFGLQEIFGNLISGIIILFERPVRLGDTVTIKDITGIVTDIRIRATTITDYDRRELIIPNKEFITGQVINWTLTNTIARLVVRVGVEHDSDIELTKKTLLNIAENNPVILKNPAPYVVFEQIADSTLVFSLRVYIPDLDVYLETQDDLNSRIISDFKKNNIHIPYPKRDIHIKNEKV